MVYFILWELDENVCTILQPENIKWFMGILLSAHLKLYGPEQRVLILFLWAGRLKRSSRSHQRHRPHPHWDDSPPPPPSLLPVLHFDTENKPRLTLLRLANVHLAAALIAPGGGAPAADGPALLRTHRDTHIDIHYTHRVCLPPASPVITGSSSILTSRQLHYWVFHLTLLLHPHPSHLQHNK